MTYLFDTSVIIDLLRGDTKIASFIAEQDQDVLTTSSLCLFEIYRGIYKVRDMQTRAKAHKQVEDLMQSFSSVISCDTSVSESAGKIWADVTRRGEVIDDIDILIAAAAKSANATLVTRNTKHFSRVSGLNTLQI